MGRSFENVKINCDLGEGRADDASLMPFLESCSIACGGHFGNEETMRAAIQLAMSHKVEVGAHPSFPDREHFGRKELKMNFNLLEVSIRNQIADFNAICESLSVKMHHVKLHGALYNLAAKDESTAKLVLEIMISYPNTCLYAPYSSVFEQLIEDKSSLRVEAFLDRNYEDDGSLLDRSELNAVIHSPEKAWLQLESMLATGTVISVHGKRIPIVADTFCIHGDNENALEIVEFIHRKIQAND